MIHQINMSALDLDNQGIDYTANLRVEKNAYAMLMTASYPVSEDGMRAVLKRETRHVGLSDGLARIQYLFNEFIAEHTWRHHQDSTQ